MKFEKSIKLIDLAKNIECEFEGNPEFEVTGLNEIHVVENGDVTFVDHPKYYEMALKCAASVIIIDRKVDRPEGKIFIFSHDPFTKFKQIILEKLTFVPATKNISSTAKIGKNTVIQPGVFVGENVTIGDNCILHANSVIYQDSIIGNHVIIHSNTCVGADAFYLKRRTEGYEKFPSCGRVIIHDKVEIGAGCTIDKGITSDTIIGEGTKLDNQVHVGHDTVIGKHCIIAAQVGISGIVKIEDYALIWGQAGIDRNLVIGKGSIVLAQSGVGKSLEAGITYFGTPAGEAREKMKEIFIVKRVQELIDRVDRLEKK